MSERWEDVPEHLRERVARLAELGVLSGALLHELRQPLFALKATAEMALSAPASDPREAWEQVLEQCRHLEELLTNFGGMGRERDEDGLCDLREPIQAAVDMLRHRAEQRDVQVVTMLPELPVWVRGRESAMRQIAVNLLSNAFDAVEGRPDRRVGVCLSLDGDRAVIEVEDRGEGVPIDVVDRMFDAFVTSKPADRGTGLGLYITRTLVHRSSGSLGVLSEPGQGTVFRVELPLVAPGRPEPR